jgi:hypothetical protein
VTPRTENQIILAGKAETASPPTSQLVTKEIGPVNLAPLAWANLLRGRVATDAAPNVCTIGSDISNGSAYVADAQLLDMAPGATSASRPAAARPSAVASVLQPPTVQPGNIGGTLGSLTNHVTNAAAAVLPKPLAPAASRTTSSGTATASAPHEGLAHPMLALDDVGPGRAVSQSRSRTLLVPQRGPSGNRLGSQFGVMSEVRETIAPVTLFRGTPNQMTIELLGEWVLQTVATGMPGGAWVHYGPGSVSPQTPIVRLIDSGGKRALLSFQDIFGDKGFSFEIPGVAEISIGEAPRAIGGNGRSLPAVAENGTSSSAAVDVVRIRALPNSPAAIGDLRVGHMEASTQVPAGGVNCPIPVTKKADTSYVSNGSTFTTWFALTNPYDCTLRGVQLTDNITTDRTARFEVISSTPAASQSPVGQRLDAGTIRWTGLHDIAPGKTEIVKAVFRADGFNGTIIDKATGSATLSDCASPGAATGAVNLAAAGSIVRGVSHEVRVPVGGVQVEAARYTNGHLPHTGAPIIQLVAIATALLALGGAGLTLAHRLR